MKPVSAPAPTAAGLHAAARAAMVRKDARAATQALAALLQAFPDDPAGWLTASIFELDLRLPLRAPAAAERALALGSTDPVLRVQHVRCLHAAGRLRRAQEALAAAEPFLAHHPHLLHELGNAAAAFGAYDDALRLMRKASVTLPEDPTLAYNMAAVLRYLGLFAEAEAALVINLRHAPRDYAAHLARAQLRRQTAEHNNVGILADILSGGIAEWTGEVQIRYALAKELEDLGRFDEAFVHLREGASLRRRHLDYDVATDIAAMSEIASRFDASYMTSEGVRGAGPIFVFGLPRSGTTLVDRILSSHPDVESLGETSDFPVSVIASAGGNGTAKRDLILQAVRVPPAEIAALYLARTALARRERTPFFIDKLPMNYLYAGLIAAALPDAKLIHVTRHPMANAYGMYKVLFEQGYPFSYDLGEIGCYMGAYERLMHHWRGLLTERLIPLRYEKLIASPKEEISRLLAACGLSWNSDCLEPQLNKAPTATQSAVQVRRPIHVESVGQWRNMSSKLQTLRSSMVAEGFQESALK